MSDKYDQGMDAAIPDGWRLIQHTGTRQWACYKGRGGEAFKTPLCDTPRDAINAALEFQPESAGDMVQLNWLEAA